MKIYLDEEGLAENFLPFSCTRKVSDIRCGILTIREKWELLVGMDQITTDRSSATHTIPSNLLPSFHNFRELINGRSTGSSHQLNYSWDIFKHNAEALAADFELIVADRTSEAIPGNVQVMAPQNIFIEPGASVWAATINASEGPVYIGKNAVVMEGSLLRGPLAICEGAAVKMGTQIYAGTTIGPHSVVGGEIKNSVIFGYTNKGHNGYLGDSVVGEWCNLGAGTSNSNIKNNAGIVNYKLSEDSCQLAAGQKGGLLMGDYSRCAINTSFNTATVVGVCCNVFTPVFDQKYIPHFTWGKDPYIFEKALADIENWKKMKGKSLSADQIEQLKYLYHKKQSR